MIQKSNLIALCGLMLLGCSGGEPSLSQENNNTWYKPTADTSWQWQLTGDIDTSYDVDLYDIDLFDTPQDTINLLHSQNKIVICYFSAGSYEEWREDASKFPDSVLGDELDGWEGERWLDIRDIDTLAPIMEARLDLNSGKNKRV